ncbi:hypothetical protein BA893_01360 [Vibrio natriegens]|uniref:glycosyltransferase family 4 protein n=1 Tax=Vibrio natriegens TaxID=691 RepID=UPI000803EC31|nr:glycosyltransferase family 4 protein [Vibrio natriegens]ANQ20390.1 hypothetical protein BA893_01360 [Vibrio natriegens]
MKKDFYFVHLLNDFSGSPRVLADLLSGFSHEGSKTLLTSQHDGFLKEDENIKRVTIPYHNSGHKIVTLILYIISQCITFFVLSALLVRGRLRKNEQVVISNTLLPFGANIAAKLFSNKLICYIHETSITPKLLLSTLTSIIKVCADDIIFVSNYVRDFHNDWANCIPSHVIYNCVSSEFICESMPSIDELSFKFNSQSVLFVGSLKVYKGIDTFVELSKSMPNLNFTAVLNSSESEFEKFYQAHGNIDNLSLIHKPGNLSDIYQQHSLLLNLSKPKFWVETFGLTLIEAMACGTPVIAPNVGGPLEVVKNHSGLVVDVTDISTLRESIQKIMSEESVWRDFSCQAYVQSKKFTKDNYTRQINVVLSND